jgi:hypothetical protein
MESVDSYSVQVERTIFPVKDQKIKMSNRGVGGRKVDAHRERSYSAAKEASYLHKDLVNLDRGPR